MADNSQRTEQASPRQIENARKRGDFPAAREFVAAMQFYAFVAVAAVYFPGWTLTLQQAVRLGLRQAFVVTLTASELPTVLYRTASGVVYPLLQFGALLVGLTLLLQMAATNLGVSLAKLPPELERLNPGPRLADLPKNNLAQLVQACIMAPIVCWLTWNLVHDRLPELLRFPMLPVGTSLATTGLLIRDVLRKSAIVLVIFGSAMLFRERSRYAARLRMSRQELQDEAREMGGNPHMKARIRKIQQDLRRRHMMRDVATATAVITNPTHYAVALKYDQSSMSAPLVVAKGKNFLAARIRQRAIENQVPIIENPPLAQALYKSIEVGQEIPPDLYRAVAEILAYIFKLMNPVASGPRPQSTRTR